MSTAQPAEMKPAYLIAGSDWPKVDAAIARLRARFAPESIEQLSAGGDEPIDVAAACNALGLFPGRRLVLVRNAEELDDDAVAGIVDNCWYQTVNFSVDPLRVATKRPCASVTGEFTGLQ